MRKTVTFNDFERAFANSERRGSFSPEGLHVLYDHLIEQEDDTGVELELDPVGIGGEYFQYDSACEALEDTTGDRMPFSVDNEGTSLTLLRLYYTVIEVSDGSVIVRV